MVFINIRVVYLALLYIFDISLWKVLKHQKNFSQYYQNLNG
jgi:hypothetical protein